VARKRHARARCRIKVEIPRGGVGAGGGGGSQSGRGADRVERRNESFDGKKRARGKRRRNIKEARKNAGAGFVNQKITR